MKTINKIGILIIGTLMTFSFWSCADADPEFVHSKNTISSMVCKAVYGASEFTGVIYEYNAKEELVSAPFTQEEVEGGHGLILFAVSKSLSKDVDLANIYLTAKITYDEFITPSLSGRQDITGDGIIVSVKSGVGTVRYYRIRGYYE